MSEEFDTARTHTDLLALRFRNLDGLLYYLWIHVRAIDLLPEHLGILLDLGLGPFHEGYDGASSRKILKRTYGEHSQLDTSFSLKLARNQSAVCFTPVKITVARSLI